MELGRRATILMTLALGMFAALSTSFADVFRSLVRPPRPNFETAKDSQNRYDKRDKQRQCLKQAQCPTPFPGVAAYSDESSRK
jgi:hypothetical protein